MRILKRLNLKDVLFIDIETSSTVKSLELDTPLFDSWQYKKKSENLSNEELIESYANEAALYAEFGRIVCISIGMLGKDGFKTTTFNNFDEATMINSFYGLLDKVKEGTQICGHSVKNFDIPYIVQRGMVHNIFPHPLMDTSGKKPWEMDWIIDTKELWQLGSFNRASLLGIVTCLGLPSPKQDLQGSDVPKYFWENPEGHIDRISEYCERDVIAVYDVLNYLKNLGKEKEVKKSTIESIFEGGEFGDSQKEELKTLMASMTPEEREAGYVILESMVSVAKGKRTKITKAFIKRLKGELDG